MMVCAFFHMFEECMPSSCACEPIAFHNLAFLATAYCKSRAALGLMQSSEYGASIEMKLLFTFHCQILCSALNLCLCLALKHTHAHTTYYTHTQAS